VIAEFARPFLQPNPNPYTNPRKKGRANLKNTLGPTTGPTTLLFLPLFSDSGKPFGAQLGKIQVRFKHARLKKGILKLS